MERQPIDEQAFLLGFARVSATVDTAALTQLSLIGQRHGFERPVGRDGVERLALAEDARPILPDATRRLFLRLFADAPKSQTDRLEQAAVAALGAAGQRLHPFDFAELEPLILRNRDVLGPAAASWAAMVRPRSDDHIEGGDTALTDLKRLREESPDRARAEIEAAFPNAPAAKRLAMLEVVAVGLGPADIAFLSALAGDKAATVRDRAAELLGRIPGTPAYGARIARARDHIKVQTQGLVFKKKSLTVHGITEKSGSLSQLLAGLRIDDLADAIGLDGSTFVEISSGTAGLDEVILEAVLIERRYELVDRFETGRRDDGVDWILMLDRLLPAARGGERTKLLEACIKPAQWSKLPAAALNTLHAAWGGPLPAAIARRLLDCDAWRSLIEAGNSEARSSGNDIPEQLAALIPLALSRQFIAEAEPLSRRAADFHRFLLALFEETP